MRKFKARQCGERVQQRDELAEVGQRERADIAYG